MSDTTLPGARPLDAPLDGSLDALLGGDRPTVRYQKLFADVQLPRKESIGAAGRDVRAYLLGSKVKFASGTSVTERGPDTSEDVPFVSLFPGERAIIPAGFRVAIPPGYEMQVRPRSGASFKKGLLIPNAPGTIDSDYRGEVGIIIANASGLTMKIEHGERIAQLVLAKVPDLAEMEVDSLDDTERGAGGFGSTGA